jgi:predicted nucleic acid-binding protein
VIVLDASVVVEILLGGERSESALPWLGDAAGPVHAPGLLDVEVTQVLRRLVLGGIMEPARGGASVEILQELPVTRHPATPLLPRIWALRHHLSAYDAAYVALAEALACPLVTFDGKLARAPGTDVETRLLG